MSFEKNCSDLEEISKAGADIFCSQEYREMLREANIPESVADRGVVRMRLGRSLMDEAIKEGIPEGANEQETRIRAMTRELLDSLCASYHGEERRGLMIMLFKEAKAILGEPVYEKDLLTLARQDGSELSDTVVSLVIRVTDTIMPGMLKEKLEAVDIGDTVEDGWSGGYSADVMAAAGFLEDPVLWETPLAAGASASGSIYLGGSEAAENTYMAAFVLAFVSTAILIMLLECGAMDLVAICLDGSRLASFSWAGLCSVFMEEVASEIDFLVKCLKASGIGYAISAALAGIATWMSQINVKNQSNGVSTAAIQQAESTDTAERVEEFACKSEEEEKNEDEDEDEEC